MHDHHKELLSLIGESISQLSQKEINEKQVIENMKKMMHLSKNISSEIVAVMENVQTDVIHFLQNNNNPPLLKKIQQQLAYLIENLLEL